MQKSNIHSDTSVQDSIYKIWKFKKVEILQNFGGGMFAIDKYNTWDLTKGGVLRYDVADSIGAFHEIPYKLIDNAIVLQLPDKTGYVDFRYKIKELTSTKLKVIMHIKFNDEGKIQDLDLVELDFEAKE